MQLKSKASAFVWIALFALAWTSNSRAADQAEVRLPDVTGMYRVGTKVWHWQRRQVSEGGRMLEVMAQLWYPSDAKDGVPARYRPLGGQSYDRVSQHSIGEAPFASLSGKAPVIVVCPGRGTNRYAYTSIAEELASRGFSVLSVDIPGIGHVEFPDGRTINPSDEHRPSLELITGPYERVDAFFEPAVSIGLQHLSIALDRLAALNADDPTQALTGRLDLRSIGLFGHSLGGRICGALAGRDERVVAYASMEGVPPRPIRQSGMRAASLMLYSSELPEDMALPNIRELYDNRIAEATILRLEGFGHNSVTDRPLISPASFDYDVNAQRGLEVSRSVLSNFFEAHLMNGEFSPTILAAAQEVSIVETSIAESGSN